MKVDHKRAGVGGRGPIRKLQQLRGAVITAQIGTVVVEEVKIGHIGGVFRRWSK